MRKSTYSQPKQVQKTKHQIDAEMAELRYILQSSSESRNDEQCQIICDFLIKGNFLKKVKNNDDFRELARYITQRQCQENEVIFIEGDEGDSFFIILEGKVNGYKANYPGENKELQPEEEFIFSLCKSQSFGEIAQDTDDPRQCTIRAAIETELIVITKEVYKQFCGDLRKQHIKEIHNFFEENMLMRSLSHETKSLLCAKSFVRRYSANTKIITQNSENNHQYFIMKGGLKLMREINKNNLCLKKLSPQYQNEFNLIRDKVHLQIQTLYKGSQFGDYEALHKESMKSSAITVIPTLLQSISLTDIKRLLNNDESQMLENNTDKPQSDEEIMEIFLENCYWKRFKNNLVQNVLSDKKINCQNGQLFRKDQGKYSDMDNYYDFLTHKGLYVFSGNGLSFPDTVDHHKKPFEKDTKKKNVGFGTAFSRGNSTVSNKADFLISTGKFITKNIRAIKVFSETFKEKQAIEVKRNPSHARNRHVFENNFPPSRLQTPKQIQTASGKPKGFNGMDLRQTSMEIPLKSYSNHYKTMSSIQPSQFYESKKNANSMINLTKSSKLSTIKEGSKMLNRPVR